ncbi:PAS domain S-box protein [Ktedonosporobacter rubrisoli]|uniref:histidine kinase n=1 Tax=Ktedonosporobacter rubrisoli TaxID=2509675 RepID=A0A4P6JIR4_KTERU|nr:ATP-binding protein [Ktedonosporobacter rubrisoli]QBD74965.1 PAS domain S-box protein [Ktedonosporobacter rubrisoli]
MTEVQQQPEEIQTQAHMRDQQAGNSTLHSFVEALARRGGEMGALIGSIDWLATPIGAIDAWPQSLRTAISMCLASGFPMLILWGPEHVQFYNDAFRPILGAKHPQSMGQRACDCWAEIWDVIEPMFAQILAGGEAIWSEDQAFFLDRYGYVEETFFTFSYSPIDDETGKVGGILCTVKETTKQVVSERRLKLLRNLAAGTSDAHSIEDACRSALAALELGSADLPFALLYLLDAQGKQARLIGATGLNSSMLEGQALLSLDEQPAERASLPFLQVIQTRQPVIFDAFASYLDPRTCLQDKIIQQACLMPIARAGDIPLAGLLVAGISPHHAFDEEYRGFFELVATHLAAAISNARTHEEERRRAEALAELDRAKTAFFSNISHEFRTPLTLSLGPLESLLADRLHPLDEEQREQVEMVRRNALRQLKLVNTLLDFARIEAGRAEARYEPTDLAELTMDVASAFRSAVERAGLQLLVDCPKLPEPIWVDRQMWEKIVLNLLSNAFKFTFKGFIRLALSPIEDGVELTVQDSGIGIRAEDVPHLFERFYRAEARKARSQEGSGIGLSLVQELVRLHAGSITVKSQENVGTIFTIRLPEGFCHVPAQQRVRKYQQASPALLADPYVEEVLSWLPASEYNGRKTDASPDGDAFLSPSQARAVVSSGARSRLLVVDDNADMRAYLQRLLHVTYQVELAADGKAALALARETLPDLIISDVMLPEMDGFAMLKALRADPLTARIPVLLLSARAGEEATLEGLAAGAEDYLVKPFSARELLARVAARLDIASLRREAEQARERLYALLMQAPAIICLLRGETHIYELANPLYLQLVGQRDILDKPIREALPELNGQGFYELLDRVYTTGEPFVGTEVRAKLDRDNTGRLEDVYFNFVYQPIRAASGQVEGILVHAVDVTEQVNARQRLKMSEARLRFLAEAMPQKIFTARPNGDVDYFNPQWTEFTGLTFEEIRDWGWTRFIHPQDLEENLRRWRQALATGEPFYCEHRFRRADGVYRWHVSRAVPIRDDEGSIVMWVGANTEIEEQKQLEERKDEFLRMASHDLRNPLTAMKGNLQLAQRRLKRLLSDPELSIVTTRQEFKDLSLLLTRALRQTDIQQRLIGDLLDVSRIQAGKLELSLEPCDLVPLVREIVLDYQASAPSRTITLSLPTTDDPVMVLADIARIGQVIANYLSNALKYSPASAPVEVGLSVQKRYARLWVRDQGPGLSSEQQQRIWERFYQAPGIVVKSGSSLGMGLGLHICRTLIARHEGSVGIESVPGQGATFWFTLPLLSGDELASV